MLNSFLKERVKRFIEESFSALWSLKTSKATHVSVAHVHGEDLISYSVNQIQSWSQVVMFGKFYGWQSYESFPTETNTNISFLSACHFRSVRKGNTKLTSLLYLYDQAFYYKLLNQYVQWTPKPLARQITTLFFFDLKVLQLNKLYVVNIACRRKWHVTIWHSHLFIVSRPSILSNVESNVLDMTNLRCEIERELSMVAQRAGLGGNKRQRRQYFEKLGPLPWR